MNTTMDLAQADEVEKVLDMTEKFFGNLKKIGTFTPIESLIESIENPIIAGKITQDGSLLKKSKNRSDSVLIYNLKEMYACFDEGRSKFQVIFLGEDAEMAASRSLRKGNYIAIRNVKLYQISQFGKDRNEYKICIRVNSLKFNASRDVYYKRRYLDSWIRFTNSDFLQRTPLTPEKLDCDPGETVYLISPVALNRRMQRVSSSSKKRGNEPQHKAVQTQKKQRSPDVVLLERDEASIASPKTLALSRENLLTKPSTSRAVSSPHSSASCSDVPRKTLGLFNEDICRQPSTSKTVLNALTNFTRGDKVKKRVTFDMASPKSKTTLSQCNLVPPHSRALPEANSREQAGAQDAFCSDFSITRDFLNNGLKRNNERPLNSEYCKLANVRKKMKVKVYGIIMRILEEASVTTANTYHMAVAIIDQTRTEEFKVHINYYDKDAAPTLRQYDLVRFNAMKVEEIHGRLQGRVNSSSNVVSFAREDTTVYFGQSKDCIVTDEDKRIVHELREWMIEHIPNARVFTPLCGLEKKNDKVNLTCQIVNKKIFTNGVIVLRVRDDTKCTKPIVRYPLEEFNHWPTVLAEAVTVCDSDTIDICIPNAAPNLIKKVEPLKIDDHVELFNVNMVLHPETFKTVKRFAIKAFMPPGPENLKIVNVIDENDTSEMLMDEQPLHDSPDSDDNARINVNKEKRMKRKLFNHDSFEEIEGNKNRPETENCDKESEMRINEVISPDQLQKKSKMRKVSPVEQSKETVSSESQSMEMNMLRLEVRIPRLKNFQIPTRNTEMQHHKKKITGSESGEGNPSGSTQEASQQEDVRNQPTSTNASLNCSILPAVSPKVGKSCETDGRDISLEDHLYHERMSICHDADRLLTMSGISVECDLTNCSRKELDREGITALNYRVKWPPPGWMEEFYIRVYVASTIPSIDTNSSHFDTLALISGHCHHCDGLYPFHDCAWAVCVYNRRIGICPKCKAEKNLSKKVDFVIACELLLQDDDDVMMPAMVCGTQAEKFFGCTALELSKSAETQTRIREFCSGLLIPSGRRKKSVILKMVQKPVESSAKKYLVLTY